MISLDARLRFLAAPLGIPGVWPQVLLMYARDLGKLPRSAYSLATIRQMCANRTFISVAAEDLALMAYQGTDWLKFGMSRFAKHLALPETEFNSALRVAVEFLQRLATGGPCHFGAASRILQRLAEALFRHKDAPSDLERKLLDAVLRALPIGDDAAVRKQLLRAAIQEGRQAAQKADAGELGEVRVLMCSEPPWIAYAAERNNSATGEVRLQAAAGGASKPGDDASPTAASGAADNPFR